MITAGCDIGSLTAKAVILKDGEMLASEVILASTHFGFPLSTTHVCTGSILGSGLGRAPGEVRWSVATRMAIAWLLTLPGAGLVGALGWACAAGIGGAWRCEEELYTQKSTAHGISNPPHCIPPSTPAPWPDRER